MGCDCNDNQPRINFIHRHFIMPPLPLHLTQIWSTCLLQSDGGGVHAKCVLWCASIGGVVVSGHKIHSESEGLLFYCISKQVPIHTPSQVEGVSAVGGTCQVDRGAQHNWIKCLGSDEWDWKGWRRVRGGRRGGRQEHDTSWLHSLVCMDHHGNTGHLHASISMS